MCSVPTETSAAERARWLAELSEALNEAHRVVEQLDWRDEQRPAAQDLYLRIQAARFEVQSLRLSRSLNPSSRFAPKWRDDAPWPGFDRAG